MTAAAPTLPMFSGEHPRSLDSALRVSLPKDWRSLQIEEFYLISGSAECYIKAMPRQDYESKVAEILNDPKLPREVKNSHMRDLGSQCQKVFLDSAGRITVPADLCKEIGIGADEPNMVFVGAITGFEIWRPDTFKDWKRRRALPKAKGKAHLDVKKFLGV
jgi:DNA-binding transcriptional regulator/RsmH inhibitor MraZ